MQALINLIESPLRGNHTYPKIFVIDLTGVGGMSATGRVKEALFRGWPTDSFRLASFHGPSKQMCLTDIDGKMIHSPVSSGRLLNEIKHFDPDLVYYRAVDNDVVHGFAMEAIEKLNKPLVVHLMDDWPERMRLNDPERFEKYDLDLRKILSVAREHLSIGNKMADVFKDRYGVPFKAYANAIDPAAFPPRTRKYREGDTFIIRYTGALADDMTFESVKDIAHSIKSLLSDTRIRLEIYTREPWLSAAEKEFESNDMVYVLEQVGADTYYSLLQDADMLLIAYNFDEASRNYIGYSVANKMPEYLASGTPILAYGPKGIATIDLLQQNKIAAVVCEKDTNQIAEQIKKLYQSESSREELGDSARNYAFENHNVWKISEGLRDLLNLVSSMNEKEAGLPLIGPMSRQRAAHWDETKAIAQIFSSTLAGNTMIDVGAHHGTALMPFLNKGWHIYAFEPDEKNRARLLENLNGHGNKNLVNLDTRCVSNKSQANISFYSSEQSTGISGLSAFHESHVESQKVDTVTLEEYFEGKSLVNVDFLKIDTEGHDLFVLQGFPWGRVLPAVIECEFEDSKTVPLGYTFHNMAQYLIDKGYSVYVSEWHPIVRYGIRHQWNRLMKYPCELSEKESWGNILAFREPINENDLIDSVNAVLHIDTFADKLYRVLYLKQVVGLIRIIIRKLKWLIRRSIRLVRRVLRFGFRVLRYIYRRALNRTEP